MNENTLTKISPRRDLKQEDIEHLLVELRRSLDGAHALNYFQRMELNHDTRHCWWPGQTPDGRKWPTADRKLMPGQKPGDVFPWPGATDSRVPLIEEIITERVTLKRVALQRGQQRIGPRNLSPDDDPQAKAVLWSQTADYYNDVARETLHTASAQVADIAEEYGLGILYVGWEQRLETVRKSISADELLALAVNAALAMAKAQGIEPTPEQQQQVMETAAARLGEIILDPEMQPRLIEVLVQYDPEMSVAEARRVSTQLKVGEPVDYYVARAKDGKPEWRALTPFIDVWFPAGTTRIKDAAWVAISEWVTRVELDERVEAQAYNKGWVDEVKGHPGRALSIEGVDGLSAHNWILGNGGVRQVIHTAGQSGLTSEVNRDLFQIIHVFWRATAVGGAPAIFHTVLHEQVTDAAAAHQCCEYAHGDYPFVEHLREHSAPYLLASRGVGEVSYTQQNEVKVQHDLRSDNASILLKPPIRVPINQAGGSVDLRPGAQIPMRNTAGMGQLEPFKLGADPRGSQEVELTTRQMINAYWQRGADVEPEVKITARQLLVSDFLADIRRAQLKTFQLVQEFAPDEIKAAFVGGMPVQLTVTKEEIQGQASLELDFDVADLDPGLTEQRVKAITALKGMDTENLLPLQPLLKALTAWLLPSHWRFLVQDSSQRAIEEAADERRVIGDILNGLEPAYVPGQNHAVRLEELKRVFGIEVDKEGNVRQMLPMGEEGSFTKPQRTATEDPDVAKLVGNRLKFHSFQLQQQENAGVGRLGVEPIREEAA